MNVTKCHNSFGYPGPCPRPTRTYWNPPPPTLSPQCAATHKFYLYTTSTFQKKIIRPGVSYTIAHRLFHILNIITPLVLSRDTANVQLILEITCCIDAWTSPTKRDRKKSRLSLVVKKLNSLQLLSINFLSRVINSWHQISLKYILLVIWFVDFLILLHMVSNFSL